MFPVFKQCKWVKCEGQWEFCHCYPPVPQWWWCLVRFGMRLAQKQMHSLVLNHSCLRALPARQVTRQILVWMTQCHGPVHDRSRQNGKTTMPPASKPELSRICQQVAGILNSPPPFVDHPLAMLSDQQNTVVQNPAHLLLAILTMERCSTPVLACAAIRVSLVPAKENSPAWLQWSSFCAPAPLVVTFILHQEASPLSGLTRSAKEDWNSQCLLETSKFSGQALCMKHTRWRVRKSN